MKRRIGWARRSVGALIALITSWMIFSPTAQALRALPGTYRLAVGQQYALNMGVAVLSSQDERLSADNNVLSARETAATEVTVNLFGLFPMVAEENYQFVMVGVSVVLIGVALSWLSYLVLAGLGEVVQRSEDSINLAKKLNE